MGLLPQDNLEQSAVTKQPCQVELVRLLDMVNPTTGSDWPPSPRTDDYCRELQSQDTSILDAFRATVSNILRDCLVKEWLQAMNMCRPRTSVESIKPAPKQQQALWSNLQRFFGEEEGRKVKFNSVPQVRIIESKNQLYPPTAEGTKIKREAFWTPWEIEVNQVRWYAHVDTEKYATSGYKCDCLGCRLEAGADDHHDEKVLHVKTSKREYLHVPEDIPAMDTVSELYLY